MNKKCFYPQIYYFYKLRKIKILVWSSYSTSPILYIILCIRLCNYDIEKVKYYILKNQ